MGGASEGFTTLLTAAFHRCALRETAYAIAVEAEKALTATKERGDAEAADKSTAQFNFAMVSKILQRLKVNSCSVANSDVSFTEQDIPKNKSHFFFASEAPIEK
ncbi:hypothetical protein RB195_018424 [Necator americanus]|uniref:Uncharacterized protein n=1 Tax=Necator americanus TaxID=51031 RepID=A0ABR1CDG8_NECAM